MSIPSSTVATLRKHWADRFIDTVTIVRVTSRGTYDEATYRYTVSSSNVEYTGGALIRPVSDAAARTLYGEQLVTGKMYSVLIPYDTAFTGNPQPEDAVTVDAATLDPDLVGQTMLVVTAELDSYKTRIKLMCRLEEGPGYVD